MLKQTLVDYLELWAKPQLAESWDASGARLGKFDEPCTGIVFCMDLDLEILNKAKASGANLIICHHPILFRGIKNLFIDTEEKEIYYELLRSGISVYAAHTNLDRAELGVSYALFRSFCLEKDFLQTLMPNLYISDESVFEPFILEKDNMTAKEGLGYTFSFSESISFNTLSQILKASNYPSGLRFFSSDFLQKKEQDKNLKHKPLIKKVLCFGGSWSIDYLDLAKDQNIDLVVTGECRYHDAQAMAMQGLSTISLGHDYSEGFILPFLALYLGVMIQSFENLNLEDRSLLLNEFFKDLPKFEKPLDALNYFLNYIHTSSFDFVDALKNSKLISQKEKFQLVLSMPAVYTLT